MYNLLIALVVVMLVISCVADGPAEVLPNVGFSQITVRNSDIDEKIYITELVWGKPTGFLIVVVPETAKTAFCEISSVSGEVIIYYCESQLTEDDSNVKLANFGKVDIVDRIVKVIFEYRKDKKWEIRITLESGEEKIFTQIE